MELTLDNEKVQKLLKHMDKSWVEALLPTFMDVSIQQCFKKLKEKKDAGAVIFPKQENIFRAFKLTPLSDIRIVILGQDPYYIPGVADGLAFSSGKRGYLPPSLRNIFEKIYENQISLDSLLPRLNGDYSLDYLAKQGVFLLNTALTVERGTPGSHLTLWKTFIENVIRVIVEQPSPVIFLLWGSEAQNYKKYILNGVNKYVLETSHPSPLSVHLGFSKSDHFKKANDYLLIKGDSRIMWNKLNYLAYTANIQQ